MGFPPFTDILSGLTMQAVGSAALVMSDVAATIDSVSGPTRAALEFLDEMSSIDSVGWAHDRAARDRGSAARAELESNYGIAATDFAGDFEPPAVSVMEYFDGMSHAEIVEFVEAMQPARMQESVEGWSRAQVLLDDHLEVFRGAISAVFAEHWTGSTASAAGRGVADYSTSLTQLTSALALVTNSLGYASVGIEQVKQRLPEPPQSTWADELRSFSIAMASLSAANIAARVNRLFHEEEEARATAVRIMQEDYAPTVTTSDSRVPVLPPAFDPTADGNAGSGGYPGAGSDTGSFGSGRESGSSGSDGSSASPTAYGGGGGNAGRDDPGGSTAGDRGSRGTGSPSESGVPGSQSSGDEASGSARTTAASADPASALPGSAAAWPGSTSPGSGNTVGNGSGMGSPGTGSTGPGSPGSVPPGFVSGTTSATPAGAAPGAARGLGRMTPMPMGMMPSNAGSGADGNRSVPGYLVTEDHGNELIGDMPATTPPVLGA